MNRRAALVAILILALVPDLRAQGTGLGIVGLGLPGRFVSARDAGMGGGITAFDAEAPLNPASIGRWRAAAGWAVATPARLHLEATGISSELRATRFPLFGFAARIRPRLAVSATIADYLDRSYEVTRRDTLDIRGTLVGYNDISRSQGGVSDLRLAAAYTLGSRVYLGAAVHAYAGSSRLVASRVFDGDDYLDFVEVSQTDFSAMGMSVGTLIALVPRRLDFGASLRIGGRLTAKNTTGRTSTVPLPADVAFGLHSTPSAGVGIAATVEYTGWSRASDALVAAGQGAPRDLWSAGVGLELQNIDLGLFHSPLRIGYRFRSLPFPVGASHLDERAFSAGLSLALAQNRTTIDLAFERGSRTGGDLTERFSALFVGVTVRP